MIRICRKGGEDPKIASMKIKIRGEDKGKMIMGRGRWRITKEKGQGRGIKDGLTEYVRLGK